MEFQINGGENRDVVGERSGAAKLGVVELFAGIGCVARGFERTGHFDPLLLTDIDPWARTNFVANRPGVPYLQKDIRYTTPQRIRRAAGEAPIAGVLGCPPCQGFSAAGRRQAEDPNNRLLADFFRVVQGLNVPFFVMENVPAIQSQDVFKRNLEKAAGSYDVWHGTLNASLYGLPQTRQRHIVIGYRRDLGVTPTSPPPSHFGSRPVFDYATGQRVRPTHENAATVLGTYARTGDWSAAQSSDLPEGAAALAPLVTTQDAIGDLASPHEETPSEYANRLGGANPKPPNHEPRGHRDDVVRRMSAVPEGGSPEAQAGTTKQYFSQAYARLHRDGLARTITTNFHNPGSGRFTHYNLPRTLTVREAARLQGIEDDFEFTGPRHVQERLVGNAFPMLWAESIGAHVASELHDAVA